MICIKTWESWRDVQRPLRDRTPAPKVHPRICSLSLYGGRPVPPEDLALWLKAGAKLRPSKS